MWDLRTSTRLRIVPGPVLGYQVCNLSPTCLFIATKSNAEHNIKSIIYNSLNFIFYLPRLIDLWPAALPPIFSLQSKGDYCSSWHWYRLKNQVVRLGELVADTPSTSTLWSRWTNHVEYCLATGLPLNWDRPWILVTVAPTCDLWTLLKMIYLTIEKAPNFKQPQPYYEPYYQPYYEPIFKGKFHFQGAGMVSWRAHDWVVAPIAGDWYKCLWLNSKSLDF